MNDLLHNPQARRLIKSLGLPIPLPQKLRRAADAYSERPLHDDTVIVSHTSGSTLAQVVAETLTAAGANPYVAGQDDAFLAAFRVAGEAHARPPESVNGQAAELKADALVFDATGIQDTADLRALYDFFHPWAKKVKRSGRVVLLGRPLAIQKTASAAAAQRALGGFVRSLAKELGRKGATAQLIIVDAGAEDRLPPVLRWILSARSAFVTGQAIEVTANAVTPNALPMTRVLDGKIALVTGAARGIGKATAHLLAAQGAHVVCLDRPADDGAVSQVARDVGGSVLLCDVSTEEAANTICNGLKDGVDIVIHNAGVTRDKTLARMKLEQWDQTIGINLTAVARITDAMLERAVLRDHGRVVCLSSVAGIAGNMGQTNYAASKAGIIGLVGYLADEVAARGITVNAVAPGFIETRLTAAIPLMIREVGRRLSALGQGGQPRDVAELITFLSTPGSHGITGSVVRVCGGAFIGA